MAASNTLKKIGIASFIMMGSVFLSRLIGVAREAAIAWVGGASYQVDAYQVAFVIPEILNHMVASGFLSITFIPIFTRYLTTENTDEGYRIFSNILNCFGLLLLIFIGITTLFAPELIRILAPGLQEGKGFELAVQMTRIIIPAQFFFFTGSLLMAVQYTHERFLFPALAPLIYNTGIIAAGLILHPVIGMKGFSVGVLSGAFIGNFVLQLIGARRCGLKYFFIFNPKHRELIRYILLTLPLMAGLTMTFSTEILMKFFGSFLPEGSISAMNFAIRIMFILVGLFGQAVGIASFPYMARIAAQNDMERLNRLINQTLKFIFVVLPFSVLFMVLRHEIVRVLFQRGAFDAGDAALTSGVLPWFLAGAFAFSAQTIVNRGFFAMQNTLFPAIFSSVCVGLSLPLIYLGMESFGIRGLALTLSLSVALTSLLLFEAWSRKSHNTKRISVYIFFGKLLGISVVIGGILEFAHLGLICIIPSDNIMGALLVCVILGLVFLAGLLLLGRLFKIEEIQTLIEKLLGRILPWFTR